MQGSQIRQIWGSLCQHFLDDFTEVTEGVTFAPKIFGCKIDDFFLPFYKYNLH